MPKGSKQKLKMYYLRKIMLQETDEDHSLSMAEIIEKLKKYDVSAERKTLYKDLNDLEDTGVEVFPVKDGRERRYYAVGGEFELAEVKLLVDAICASKFFSTRKSSDLIKKIGHLVSKYEARSLQRQVYLSGRVKTMNESVYYSVDAVHRAILKERKIRFLYCGWSPEKKLVPRYGGKMYEISPWALSFNDECYYMIGYDSVRGEIRHYRVDKMMRIDVTDKPRDGKDVAEQIEIGKYITQNFGMCGGEIESVRIQLPKSCCGVFIDRFGKDIEFREVDEDTLETSVTLALSETFYGWLFGLGPEITVVGSKPVVEDIAEFAGRFAEKYKRLQSGL